MALAIGTYEPPTGISGEIRTQFEAQFGPPPTAALADAQKMVLAMATAWFNILTGASAFPPARASTSTPNAQAGGATLPGSIV